MLFLPLTREVSRQLVDVTEGEKKEKYEFVSPPVCCRRQPLTAAVPFVASRHFPALRGITLLRGGK